MLVVSAAKPEVTLVWSAARLVVSVVRSVRTVFWLETVAIPPLTVKEPMLEAVKLMDELDTAAPTR